MSRMKLSRVPNDDKDRKRQQRLKKLSRSFITLEGKGDANRKAVSEVRKSVSELGERLKHSPECGDLVPLHHDL